jgi:hypothetical protein
MGELVTLRLQVLIEMGKVLEEDREENTVVVLVNCRGIATYRSRYCIAYIQWPRRVVQLCNALQMVVPMLVAAAQPRKEMAMAAYFCT